MGAVHLLGLSISGGRLGTRTLNASLHNGFQDRPTTNYHSLPYLERHTRIEPALSAWKAEVLPLHHIRILLFPFRSVVELHLMELIERIELSLPGYDAGVLPLNYISIWFPWSELNWHWTVFEIVFFCHWDTRVNWGGFSRFRTFPRMVLIVCVLNHIDTTDLQTLVLSGIQLSFCWILNVGFRSIPKNVILICLYYPPT